MAYTLLANQYVGNNGYGGNAYLRVYYEVASQSVANNSSTVNLQLRFYLSGGGSISFDTRQAFLHDSGWFDIDYKYSQNIEYTLKTMQVTIAHDSEGNGSFNVGFGIRTSYNLNWTGVTPTATLPKIPRAATLTSFTCSSSYLNGTMKINYNSKTTFTYYLRLSVPNVKQIYRASLGSQTAGNKSTSHVFTAAELNSIYALIPSAEKTTIGAVIETYSGSTKIGESSEATLTLNVPTNVKPTVSASIAEAISGLASKFGAYIKTKSKVKVSISASAGTGSSLRQYVVKINGNTITSNTSDKALTIITDFLKNAGANTYEITVTDLRNRSATFTGSFNVVDYFSPIITTFSVHRCNADGTANDDGTSFIATIQAKVAPCGNKNDKSFVLNYKKESASSYTAVQLSNDVYEISVSKIVNNIDENSAYEVQMKVQDYFSTSTKTIPISTAFTLMDFLNDGTGVAFGRVSTKSNTFQSALNMEIEGSEGENIECKIDGGTYAMGLMVGSGRINRGLYDYGKGWMIYRDASNDIILRTGDGKQLKVHSDGTYLGFDGTDGGYIRTPVNGLLPRVSGGSGYVGTSAWPFNEGYFRTALYMASQYSSSGGWIGFYDKFSAISGSVRKGFVGFDSLTSKRMYLNNEVSDGDVFLGITGSKGFLIDSTKMRPTGTGVMDIGSTSNYLGNIFLNGNIKYSGGQWVYAPNITRLQLMTQSADPKQYVQVTSGSTNYGLTAWVSDARLKENIVDSECDSLSVVDKIQHRSFNFIGSNYTYENGYIAQEMEEVDQTFVLKVPKMTEIDKKEYFAGDYTYQIDSNAIIPHLTKAIQQLHDEIKELKKEIEELKNGKGSIQE